MDRGKIYASLEKAREYIDGITVDSSLNVPEEVVGDEHSFFTWDNEHRSPTDQPYLFDWSYYNGVVMEGLFDLWEAGAAGGERYLDYVRRYLDSLITTDDSGEASLDFKRAGYVDYHGADCYKTAALLLRASDGGDGYMDVCRRLYRDITDEGHVNSRGHIVAREYRDASTGFNYWHTWAKGKPPRYTVWLDGIYMLQPFISRFAAMTADERELGLVIRRLDWAASELLSPCGLYYHAGSSRDDVCPWHWTRAMGWYGMAMVDVMEVLPEWALPARREALRIFADGVLRYQKECGLWTNITDLPVSGTNRTEVSGSAMLAYTILKGVRMGWLDESFRDAAVRAFTAIVDEKLVGGRLTDIYLKASANGSDNYEREEYYLPDEGKGLGPFIMAFSEMIRLFGENR